MYKTLKQNCIICDSNSHSVFFERNHVPIHPYINSKKDNFSGKIKILKCKKCNHLHNYSFEEKLLNKLYSSGIITNTPVSDDMVKSIFFLKEWLLTNCKTKISKILEIGGGSGALAACFNDIIDHYLMIEPGLSDQALKNLEKYNNIIVSRSGFPNSEVNKGYDLIICRQVLEHVSNPLSFLKSIYEISSESTFIYIEIPSADYIVSNKSVIDFHYPHVHYYFENNAKKLFQKLGFKVSQTQYLKNGHDIGFLLSKSLTNESKVAKNFNKKEFNPFNIANIEISKKNKIALYGANAYSQSFLGLYALKFNILKVFDDTPVYKDNFCYYKNKFYPILIPNSKNIKEIDDIIITAYLHDSSIFKKLVKLGFKGNIFTLRNEKTDNIKKLRKFFIN